MEPHVATFRFTVAFYEKEDLTLGRTMKLEHSGVPEELITSILEQLVRHRKENEYGNFRASLES